MNLVKKKPAKPNLLFLIGALLIIYCSALSQNGVGIGIVTPDASAVLHVQPPIGVKKGLLIPRLSTSDRVGVTSPADGLLVFDTGVNGFYFSSANTWYSLNEWVKTAGGNDVSLAGNASISGTMTTGNVTNSGTVSTNSLSVPGFSNNALVPTGVIVMWSGAIGSIPSGWALCNGQPGTPDLRDRFIVGAGSSYSVGITGGANTVALIESEMPSHSHTMSFDGNHQHSYSAPLTSGDHPGGNNGYARPNSLETNLSTGLAGSHVHAINPTGGNQAHENRPPYYALAYIIKL